MKHVIQSMIISMELRGFAKSTQRTYLAHIQRFLAFCDKPIAEAGYEEVRAFLHHAIAVRNVSAAYVNSAYGAIKFYYQSVLCREWNMLHVPRMKKRSFLPTILSPHEVLLLLRSTPNLKHKAMLSTLYLAFASVKPHISAFPTSTVLTCAFLFVSPRATRIALPFSPRRIFCPRQYWKTYTRYLHLTHAQVLDLKSPLDHHTSGEADDHA